MSEPPASAVLQRGLRKRFSLPASTVAALALAALVVLLTATFAHRSMRASVSTAESVVHTLDVLDELQLLLTNVTDAETGQRAYLLTGTENYLVRYTAAQASLPGQLARLRALVADNPRQVERVGALEPLVTEKLDELRETISLRRAGDADGALAIVRTDRGKVAMDRIRGLVTELQRDERTLLAKRQADYAAAVGDSFRGTLIGAIVLLLLIGATGWFLARSHREREIEAWLRTGLAGVSQQLLGERRLHVVGERALGFLSRFLGAAAASLYVIEGDGRSLKRLATYANGVSTGASPDFVTVGEGLVGQVAHDGQPLHLRDLPDDYLVLQSTLGRGRPKELLIAPAALDDSVYAALEFGFLRRVKPEDRELLARVSQAIATAIRSSRDRERVEALLAETQTQSEELQTQQEELRVSNEELEEQGRALKASQVQLESQQAELEQTNSQLEEQAQSLEDQKSALTRSQDILSERTRELERSNQYKSEFLANMSHELRTPLNSTLILAKLLADNKGGNLTAEQVKFAETISSAGNDLLLLINDILDLSKIEAGKVEMVAESLTIARFVEDLQRTFEPMARTKNLAFGITVEPGTPDRIDTDPHRLAQIVRNLLSNAIKFTEAGEVTLRASSAGDGKIAFAVADSGIGIAPSEQQIIFEAFRQADGSTHRRYGGTGLGLSISRDLARLLGGDIVVQSEPARGSVFTLTIPTTFRTRAKPAPGDAAPLVERRGGRPAAPPPSARPVRSAPPPASRANEAPGLPTAADDDRDRLTPTARLILIIEDDVRFATILQDLAHEMGFQCIVTHGADEGLSAAIRYKPSAILLDINLPDYSGLGVLDQLKRNPETRHIPVHVASVEDYSHEALELGAVGYDFKPVRREQIVDALEGLRQRFSQQFRRVLVVEDDARQLDSIRQLLENESVQIVGAARASDALAELQASTFDCMVMDLNLPDLSGYDLLEQMSANEDVAFPPVIVYTGRVLSRDEEQRLGRYSRSIIIKDARSPERLLDEVTLFLHQVEAELPPERQKMLREARSREATLENRRILVVEDDVRNIFALTSVLEPKGVKIEIARNGREALDVLGRSVGDAAKAIDLVLMDIMMPEMDGYTAMREIRREARWKKLPIIALTAKAMRDDQEKCLAAGANDYISKPLDVEKLLSLVRVWMPK